MKKLIIISLVIIVILSCRRQVELKQVNNENDSIIYSEYEYAEKYLDNYAKILAIQRYLYYYDPTYTNKIVEGISHYANYYRSEFTLNNLKNVKFNNQLKYEIPDIFNLDLQIKFYDEPRIKGGWMLDIRSQDIKIGTDSNMNLFDFYNEIPAKSFNYLIDHNLKKKKDLNFEEVIKVIDLFTKIAFSFDFSYDLIDTLTSEEIRSSNLKVLTEKQGYRVTGYLPKSKYNVDYLLDSNCHIIEWDVKYIDESFKEVFKELRKGKIE